ncbi:hypothetical protein LPLAFNJD_LOCUS2714 [Methylorubrum aminovorans]
MARTRLTLRELRASAALRSARARSRRAALQRPEGRDVELALGKAVASVLAERAVARPGGAEPNLAALRAHPDLAAILTTASASLRARFADGEVAAALRSCLSAAPRA